MSNASGSPHWYDLGWYEWVGLAGFLLTLIGLFFTWRQARDADQSAKNATTAATAAKNAVQSTQRQLRANQLLVLIPQLRWIASALEESIDEGDSRLVRKHLDTWRWSAANLHGILKADDEIESELLEKVQDSVGQAFVANTALQEGKSPLINVCKKARGTIAIVCTDLTTWAGSQSASVPTPKGDDS